LGGPEQSSHRAISWPGNSLPSPELPSRLMKCGEVAKSYPLVGCVSMIRIKDGKQAPENRCEIYRFTAGGASAVTGWPRSPPAWGHGKASRLKPLLQVRKNACGAGGYLCRLCENLAFPRQAMKMSPLTETDISLWATSKAKGASRAACFHRRWKKWFPNTTLCA